MSAESLTPEGIDIAGGRTFEFRMREAIPPYLIALAVGELGFAPLGPRSGVYAEPATLEAARSEFADVEQMIDAAERLLGAMDQLGSLDGLAIPDSGWAQAQLELAKAGLPFDPEPRP